MTAPVRPLLRWHGGKWLLAPWIIGFFPQHRCYVEPFGGAWSVGLRKRPSLAEVWNDLDDELVNLFRLLRDPEHAAELVRLLRLTPFARAEFYSCYEPTDEPLERARRMIARSFMGHGADGASGVYRAGFRSKTTAERRPPFEWSSYPDALLTIIDRVSAVLVENAPAIEVMARHDGPETLHYVDPPYLHETRARANRRPDNGGVYRHELTGGDHQALLNSLKSLRGMVVLSGYPSAVYDRALADWTRVERAAMADGALERTEVLWLNAACVERLGVGPLFEAAA